MECPQFGFAPDGFTISEAVIKVGLMQQVFNYAIQHYQPVISDPLVSESTTILHDRVQSLDNQMVAVRDDLCYVRATLDVTVARQLEDRCTRFNDNRLSRIVIHGLPKISGPSREEVKKVARETVTERLSRLFPDFNIDISFVDYYDSRNPIYEVTFSCGTVATQLRQNFGRRPSRERKATGISIMNCVTPATRVRISILKVISF